MITLSISTNSRMELVDITARVNETVRGNEWTDGLLTIYCPHTTAAITINECADPSVRADIVNTLAKLIPHPGNYSHTEGNSDAHIKASLVGPSEQIIVESGRLALGTWQGIFFCEFDGPRERRFHLNFISE